MSAERFHDPDYAEPPLTRSDIELVIQRSMRDMQPQVVYQQNGWKLAALLLSALAAILVGIGSWGLVTLLSVQRQVDTVQSDVAVLKCQLSDACKHPILRGAD